MLEYDFNNKVFCPLLADSELISFWQAINAIVTNEINAALDLKFERYINRVLKVKE